MRETASVEPLPKEQMRILRLTSESVTEGHPDKLCDQISDSILDAYLAQDPTAHVAVECMISNNLLVIAGEINSTAKVSVENIARNVLIDVGYTSKESGINGKTCLIIKNIHEQSSDICQGVRLKKDSKKIGAGDQGIMYGFACQETEELMPLPITLAHRLTKQLSLVRKNHQLPYLLPDGKAQVTVEYDENYQPLRIADIIVSAQHLETVTNEDLVRDIKKYVINPVVTSSLVDAETRILINPTGRFVLGGPMADTGLTGRKIVVDTYGGAIPHGGGAFSGKDATKVDRSAAYMARYAAKNLVAAGLVKRCQIAVSYAIGGLQPSSIYIDTFGTHTIPLDSLYTIAEEIFDFSPGAIIETLQLQKPIYRNTSVYGHFKDDGNLPWEKIDKKELLSLIAERIVN